MLNKAPPKAFRCIRVQSLINEEFGFLMIRPNIPRLSRLLQKDVPKQRPEMDVCLSAFLQLLPLKGNVPSAKVNVDLCKKFREYLLNAKQLKHSNRPISLNSASGYYSTFRGLLKIAYRDKWFPRRTSTITLINIEPQDVKRTVRRNSSI